MCMHACRHTHTDIHTSINWFYFLIQLQDSSTSLLSFANVTIILFTVLDYSILLGLAIYIIKLINNIKTITIWQDHLYGTLT